MRLQQTSSVVASSFRSGLWVKDENSFVNVGRVLHDATLQDIRIYRFDSEYRLLTISQARSGTYQRDNLWKLQDVVLTRFEPDRTSVERIGEMEWRSVLTPRILSVLLVPPEKMSLFTLFSYVQHLRNNNQESGRYEIALWNKLIYPIAILVMMVVALPFSYLNVREGGISTKIFAGIMLGLLFHVAVAIIPVFVVLREIHLLSNPLGVALPQAAFALPLSIVIMRPFLRAIPGELQDAAEIDGCGPWRFYWSVVLPLSRPVLSTVAVITLVTSWNAFLLPLLVLVDPNEHTVPIGVNNISTQYTTDYARVLAYTSLAMLPALIFYAFAERQIVGGLTAGAVKD